VHEKVLSITNHKRNANKTPLRYPLIPIRMIVLKKTKINADKGMDKREPLCTVGGNVNW